MKEILNSLKIENSEGDFDQFEKSKRLKKIQKFEKCKTMKEILNNMNSLEYQTVPKEILKGYSLKH